MMACRFRNLGVWALAGVVMWLLYRPPGTMASGPLLVGAGLYELTPLKRVPAALP